MTRRTSEPPADRATSGSTSRKPKGTRRARGENRRAVDATIAELQRLGQVKPADAARIQALRSIADTLDMRPTNSQMWKEYREGLEELMGRGDDSDQQDAIVAKLRTPLRVAPPA
jgi:soluble cytochrome b562